MNNRFRRLAIGWLAAVFTPLLLASCDGSVSLGGETSPSAEETALPFPDVIEKLPTGEVDADADSLDTIVIRTAEELMRIGKDPAFPLDGDYTLVADLNLSDVENFTPIGGAESQSGIVAGDNVFSGTFDGRGHTLVGLKFHVSAADSVHVGLFGTVASTNAEDPAVIRNLILKDVSVTGTALGPAAYAALIGQASGYVTIDNIALLSGKVEIRADSGDLLGVASLIGQCRTDTATGYTNEGIHITNIYTNLTVIADNNGKSNYTSGLIGRIRGSNLGTLREVLQLGAVTHENEQGYAIAAGDVGIINRKNVFYLEGVGINPNLFGSGKTTVALNNATIPLLKETWHIERGLPPMPIIAYESPLFSPLDFLTLSFTGGESVRSVQSDFDLPDTVLDEPVRWISSNERVIAVNGSIAVVTPPKIGMIDVVLTAYTAEEAKSFTLRVRSTTPTELLTDFETKTLYAKNYPEDTEFTWVIEDMTTGAHVQTVTETEGKLALTVPPNCKITLKAKEYEDIVYYYTSIPTLAITSPTTMGSLSKNSYAKGSLTIYTVEGQEKTEYDGSIQLKLRGNTTAYRAKIPLRLKLDTKTDLFGMGKSKHWALLANYSDRSHLRNKLAYDLGLSLGLTGCESTFVNVIYNGEYQGLYLLTETVRVDEGRVDIFDWEETAEDIARTIAAAEGLSDAARLKLIETMQQNLRWVTSGTVSGYTISDYYDISDLDITGGYLIENDDYYDERVKFTTENGMRMMLQGPEYLDSNQKMFGYITDYIQAMEDALYAPNRLSDEGKHYSEYMDVDSFLDFFMVNQVFKNVELFYKSCYMYKDVDAPLTFVPIWDMDYTAGNHVALGELSAGPESWEHGESQNRVFWYRAVYSDPWFVVLLTERWEEIQENLDAMMAELDTLWAEIETSAMLDYERWKLSSTTPTMEVAMLREWLITRRTWMSEQMASPDTLLASLGYYIPSQRITIAAYTETDDALLLTISVTDEATIKACDILLNGTVIREEAVTDGTVIRIDKALLREDGGYNAIELIGKKADGDYSIVLSRGGQHGSDMADSACMFYIEK